MNFYRKALIVITLSLTSCSALYHVKQAERHIEKANRHFAVAERRGTKIDRTTEPVDFTFRIDGPRAAVDLGQIILQRKDGVVYVPVVKDTIIYKERIKIEFKDGKVTVDCPDSIINKKIDTPVINVTPRKGYSTFQYITAVIGAVIFGGVVGFILGKLIKVGVN